MARLIRQDKTRQDKTVTGTQHAPVESQIERVSSVSAQLAPDRYAELSWHQTDMKPAM